MHVVGVSHGYHDAAAALVRDGQPVFFSNAERFTLKKNDPGFPRPVLEHIQEILGKANATPDAAFYYEDPLLKADRVMRQARQAYPDPSDLEAYTADLLQRWKKRGTVLPLHTIGHALRLPLDKVLFVRHHESHAALAYYMSPYDRALVITLDGVGEDETLTVWIGEGCHLRQIHAMTLPNSIGLLYSTITAFCGFEINEGEYKLMGLAAFGEPAHADIMREWVRLAPDETRCQTDWLQWTVPKISPFSDAFVEQFGPPFRKDKDDPLDPRFADLAASVQLVVEEEIERLVAGFMEETGIDTVCLGGGVALNCNVNGRLRRGVCPNLYVPTAPGDAGSALGAALAGYHRLAASTTVRKPKIDPTPYLGTDVDTDYFQTLDLVYRPVLERRPLKGDDAPDAIAGLLADGLVLGHMFGPFEMGPRALGHRSILADPRSIEMKDRVNRLIKHREPFRPFAPAVLEEEAGRFFEIPDANALGEKAPERYMLATHPVTEHARETIPAAIHVDGTARVQIVSERLNPRFHAILTAFKKRTGVPVLLNTSLNVAGQPMASTVWSGTKTLLDSLLDGLVVEDQILIRNKSLPSS